MLAWLAVALALCADDGAVAPPLPPLPPPPLLAAPPVEPPITPLDGGGDFDPQPIVAHPYLYTALETALVLAGGTIWYVRRGTDERWSRALEWRAWRRKLLAQDVTFDGDRFDTNAIGHPIDGAGFYQIARGNGLGPGGSFVSSLLASTFWEYFVELPEHPSLNDMIVTPIAGSIIGETTYRLGRFLSRTGAGGPRCLGAFLLAPVAALNDRPICRAGGGLLPWAKLGLSTGVGRAIFDGGPVSEQLALAVGAELVTQRAYERAGSGMVPVTPGQWTALTLDSRWGDTGLAGLWFHAEAVWGGRYDRSFRATAGETDVPVSGARPRGWGTMLGLGSVFDYRFRDLPAMQDRLSTLGLAGPMFELSARGRLHVRLSLSAQYAFAIIGSMAYRAGYPTVFGQTIKTSLRDSGYYYAHGAMSAVRLTVDLGPVGFMGDARGGWFWSIDSGDPAQSVINRHVSLRDTRLYLTGAMWSRPLSGFRFGLTIEHIRRASHMLDSSVRSTEDDVLGTAALGF